MQPTALNVHLTLYTVLQPAQCAHTDPSAAAASPRACAAAGHPCAAAAAGQQHKQQCLPLLPPYHAAADLEARPLPRGVVAGDTGVLAGPGDLVARLPAGDFAAAALLPRCGLVMRSAVLGVLAAVTGVDVPASILVARGVCMCGRGCAIAEI